MMQVRYKHSVMMLLVATTLLFSSPLLAQQLSKAQVRVAYVYNFLKHISWPEENKKQQFVIAVYQDKKFYSLLTQSIKNKQVKNKPLTVISIDNIAQGRAADLLYIPSKFNKDLTQIATQVRGSLTLLVTENSDDKHNAMLNLMDSDDAIYFEVNKSNIVYEQLKISAQLLLLGGTELDIAYLYRETEQAMQQTRERAADLNSELAIQQAKIANSNAQLNDLNQKLQRSSKEIRNQQLALEKLTENEQAQQIELENKEQKLASVLQQLADANKNFHQQTQAISHNKQQLIAKEQENLKMAEQIKQNQQILDEQQQNITKQQQALDFQNTELAEQQQTIVEQKTTITITSVFIIFIAFALILVISLFIKHKRTSRKLSQALAHLEETQNQLIQSEKMASLGKLIAGVAHELNTPLGIAVTSTSLIKENTEELAKKLNNKTLTQKQLQSFIHLIDETAIISNRGLERVIELMHNFKEVASDQIIDEVRKVNIAHYIDEVMSTLASELKKKQVIYQYSGETDTCINTIPGALAQVITNLVNNSLIHAFDTDGKVHSLNNTISIHVEQNSHDEIKLIYTDNGKGMDEETLAQVFEPFFTTKRNQGGTGLGMNIVFNIVEQKLSGHITIESTKGQGITCTLILPLILAAPH